MSKTLPTANEEKKPLLETDTLFVETRTKQKSSCFTIFFVVVLILGLTGQNVTLPLWIDSTIDTHNSTNSTSDNYKPFADQYFYVLLPSFAYALIFGSAQLINTLIQPQEYHQKFRRVPKIYLLPAACMFGAGGTFITFAASGTRTAPYLQSILTNIGIPSTLIIRYFALKKIPTRRKLICALTTSLSLFICLFPSIVPSIDPVKSKAKGGAEGVAGVLWPLCFMLGFVCSSVANILEERAFTAKTPDGDKPPDIIHAVCWVEFFMFVFLLLCFWIDAIPGFGNVSSISHVGQNLVFGIKCFFGGGGCSSRTGLLGALFISLFALYIAGANYMINHEGATYLVIVQSVVTPLGFFFWTLFKEQPSFHWGPAVSVTTWFNIVGLFIMVPSIYLYNTGPPEKTANSNDEKNKLLSENGDLADGRYHVI
ncbi:uncharacterized protein LOC116604296 [Nematostella vectensis]|uniref:uncharacterized protein LOC116604296 n=1 Tax=Nematostella vectensis TaxID=45351 RepID=UPI002076E62D|nr:uncharacterized protein LOC116604296 [Nematostella vectensis]